MPSARTVLAAAAALLLLAPGRAPAQDAARPYKRVNVVTEGMTPGQVRAVLGEPLRTRRDGALTYLYYANGCQGCAGDDYVVVRDCRVVGARFENPGRFVSRSGEVDPAPPPAAECRASAADPVPVPLAAAPREVPPPNDVDPRGAPPAEQPRIVVAGPPSVDAREAGPAEPDARQEQLDPARWRKRLTLRRPATRLVAVPAASISSPTAFGAQMGEGFVGFAYQARTRFTQLSDGALVIAGGVGNRRVVALEAALTSYSTLHGGGPLETGGLSLKLHRALGDAWSVAVGMENALDWGGSDAGHSPYAVATHVFRLQPDAAKPFSAATASLGVGGGRFRPEDDVVAHRETANVFAALGVQVLEPVSLAADWNGQDLFAGVSVAPTRHVPFVVNAGFADITGSAGDGARFILSAGLGFRWIPPFF